MFPNNMDPIMRITRFFIVALCLAFTQLAALAQQPSTQPSLPESVKLDLFLLVGQSNMAGRGKVETIDQTPNPHIWVLNKEKQWSPAVEPLHWDRPERIGVGPGFAFARAVVDKFPQTQIGLIPAAEGGSSIDLWKKGDPFYTNAIERAKLAQKHGIFRAILWHQGEADSTPEGLPNHMAKVQQLVKDLRADLGDPNLPFVAGQIGSFYEKRRPDAPKMNDLLLTIPQHVARSAVVTSENLTQMGDDTHFDAAGARELGKRYAAKYIELVSAGK